MKKRESVCLCHVCVCLRKRETGVCVYGVCLREREIVCV